MICYLDRTFCISKNCQNKCGRKLTKEIVRDAIKWWGSEDVPVAISCFCSDENIYKIGKRYDELLKEAQELKNG